MSGPSVRLRLPPLSLFKFPPDNEPQTLPPPRSGSRFAAPFPINERIYNAVLEPSVPVTIAAVYFVTVLYLNRQNRRRGGKPWKISQTSSFFAFVLFHNIALALYSAATFAGLLRALRHSWPSHREYEWIGILWPGLRTQNSFAGAADALCKLHGPRGFGDAASYSVAKGAWEVKNQLIKLGLDGGPDSTDVGRLWNEGLGFWGWWFYLSKFYEVVDTLIILMKGKKSSTLQVYHHMGAMLAMWAGIRYMSPPIWMFTFINSGIHALMYTYYTLSALNIRVPRRAKKTLTSMQITQFFVGFTFAAGHLFIEYTVPASTAYMGKQVLMSATSTLQEAYSTVSSQAAAATASAGLDAWMKKLVYRAAGQEGLAGNVRNQYGEVFGPEADLVREQFDKLRRTNAPKFETIPCLDTSGQAFAIWFNLIYLAPLTWLFLRFFMRAYTRPSAQTGKSTKVEQVSNAASSAARDVDRKVENLAQKAASGLDKGTEMTKEAVKDGEVQSKKSKKKAQKAAQDAINTTQSAAEQASVKAKDAKENLANGKIAEMPTLRGEATSSSQDSTVLVEREDATEKSNGQTVTPGQAVHANGSATKAPADEKEELESEGLSTENSKAAGAPSYADKAERGSRSAVKYPAPLLPEFKWYEHLRTLRRNYDGRLR